MAPSTGADAVACRWPSRCVLFSLVIARVLPSLVLVLLFVSPRFSFFSPSSSPLAPLIGFPGQVPAKVDADQLDEFRREVATMAAFSHPRLALLLGAALPDQAGGRLLIVIELLAGDMGSILERDRKLKRLSLVTRMTWAKQAAEGLAWLHGAGVVHRDMKVGGCFVSFASCIFDSYKV